MFQWTIEALILHKYKFDCLNSVKLGYPPFEQIDRILLNFYRFNFVCRCLSDTSGGFHYAYVKSESLFH